MVVTIDTDSCDNNKLASSKLRQSETITDLLTGVKCRATSVAKKLTTDKWQLTTNNNWKLAVMTDNDT